MQSVVILDLLKLLLKAYKKIRHMENENLMEKYAWKAYIKDGCFEEYCKRHNNIWPEMIDELKKSGICNYTIWHCNNELFGYYECDKGVDFATSFQAQSDIVKRWNEYMKDILIMELDSETGAQPKLEKVFEMI